MKRLTMTVALALLAAAAIAAPANADPVVEVVNANNGNVCDPGCVIEDMEGTFDISHDTWPMYCDATFDFHIETDGTFELRNIYMRDRFGWVNCSDYGVIGSPCRVGGVATWPGTIESGQSQESFTGTLDICYGNGQHTQQPLTIVEDEAWESGDLNLSTEEFEIPPTSTGQFNAQTNDSTIEIISLQ